MIKEAILRCLEVSEGTHRQGFGAKKGPGIFTPLRLDQYLDKAAKWLLPAEKSPDEILGQTVLE